MSDAYRTPGRDIDAIACGPCVRAFWSWMLPRMNGKAAKRSRRFEGMISFYEAAGKKP